MGKSRLPSDEHKLLKRLVARYAEEDSDTEGQATARAQEAFWTDMREVLSVNEGSAGLDILDDIAEAVIDKTGAASDAFGGPIFILPKPTRQKASRRAELHPRFTSSSPKNPSSTESSPRNAPDPKIAPSKKRKGRSSGESSTPPPSPQKTRYFTEALADSTPQEIRDDLEDLYRRVAHMNRSAFQSAFPWKGSRLWYDPEEYPQVYLAHWRWWNRDRRVFFDWQLHVPLKTQAAQSRRRKQKMEATAHRVTFLSTCIKTWGFYNFLELMEDCDDPSILMWWGGQPGRNQSRGPGYHGPVIESLTFLRRRDVNEYDTKMKNALVPFSLNAGGFSSVTEMLLWTDALDPYHRRPESRLDDRALALVLIDLQSDRQPRPGWANNNKEGVWSLLRKCTHIVALARVLVKQLQDGTYQTPVVKAFDPKEVKSSYDPFEFKGRPSAYGSGRVDASKRVPTFNKATKPKAAKTRSNDLSVVPDSSVSTAVTPSKSSKPAASKSTLASSSRTVPGNASNSEASTQPVANDTKTQDASKSDPNTKPSSSSTSPAGSSGTSSTSPNSPPKSKAENKTSGASNKPASPQSSDSPESEASDEDDSDASDNEDEVSQSDHEPHSDSEEEKPPAKKPKVRN